MLNDRVSKPVAGRYFPITSAELATRVAALAFAVHSYNERLPILLENCTVECDRGYQLCSFLRMGYLAVFSLPIFVPRDLAQRAVEVALQRFSAIDRGPRLSVREQQFVMYRAFLGPLGALSITQHVINAVSRPYLQFLKLSQLSKSGQSCKGQLELLNVQVA